MHRIRPLVVAALLLAFGACSDDGAPEATPTTATAPATTAPGAASAPSSYTVAGEVTRDGSPFASVTAQVEAADRWSLSVLYADGARLDRVRLGEDAFSRLSPAGAPEGPFVPQPWAEVDPATRLALGADGDPADVSVDALLVAATTDPASLASQVVERRPGAVPGFAPEPPAPALPPSVAGALDAAGLPAPDLRVEALAGPTSLPVSMSVALDGPAASFQVDLSYAEVDVAVEEPDTGGVDTTPFIDEEALLAYVDAPLVAPAQLPAGLALARVQVLPAGETLEGCAQIELSYLGEASDGSEDAGVYVFSPACAAAASDVPFDEEVGGHPARVTADGFVEVEFGGAVVQFLTARPRADVEIMAASLDFATVDALADQLG